MHYEFAIDPKSITTDFRTFKQVIEKFGFDKGLLLSTFPSKWKRDVYSNLSENFSELERKSVEKLLKNDGIIKANRDYNSNAKTWVEAACTAHSLKPFHAIITSQTPVTHQDMITVYDICYEECQKMIVPHEVRINKIPAEYVKVTKLLLENSKEIIIVDPYFQQASHKILSEIIKPLGNNIPKIKYFTYYNPNGETLLYRRGEVIKIDKHIPKGISIEFNFVDKSKPGNMHNRYIITEKGGLKFGSSMTEAPNKKDEINIMSKTSYLELYNEYTTNIQSLIIGTETVKGTLT